MPKLAERKDCTGCQACKFICPRHCIEMRENPDGATYPAIDASRCIECNACERICPALHPVRFNYPKRAYAAWNTSHSQRERSASGGIASAIYALLKDEDGISVGATVGCDWSVDVTILKPGDSFERLKNSKYSYSNPSEVYSGIKSYIKE